MIASPSSLLLLGLQSLLFLLLLPTRNSHALSSSATNGGRTVQGRAVHRTHLNHPSDLKISGTETKTSQSPPPVFTYSIASILDLDSSKDNFLATQVWPSARVAAQALLQYDPSSQMSSSKQWKLCEFGCGPGLPSLAAAHTQHYSQVMATDVDEFCLELVEAAAKDQGLEHTVKTQVLDLTKDPKHVLEGNGDAQSASYSWMKDIDMFIMADIFENAPVAQGAARWTMFLLKNPHHRPRIWVFAQSDRAQREIYLETLRETYGKETENLKWLPLGECNEKDSLWLVDLEETQVQYGFLDFTLSYIHKIPIDMSFLLQYDDGLDLENYEANDDIMGYVYSSNYESSDADDCYIEALKTEPTMNENSGTTIAKLKKDGSLSSFEAPLSPPRPRSRAATSASAPSSAPSSLVGQQQQRRKKKKKTKQKTKKAVQFSNADEFYGILSLKEFTKKERRNCWYTKADLIKRDACLDWFAQRIEGKTEPKGDETYRGLEDLDVEQREKSEERRISVIEAVLNAQDEHEEEQVEFGVVEPVFLAVASMEMSQDSKTDALEVGMMDMLEVLPFTFQPKNPRRSLPAGLEVGTIIDPYPVPDRPRRYSAPATSIKDKNATHSNEEMMEALALFDEIDISSPLPPPALEVPAVFRTPETTKTKKRKSSGRHSLDSSSKHNKSKSSKSKSRSDSSSVSPRKNKKSIIVNKKSIVGPPPSPHMQSPVKKKAKETITNSNSNHHLPSAVPSPEKTDDSKSSRSRSRSPSSNKPPFSVTSTAAAAAAANVPSVPAAKATPPLPFAIKKKPTNKTTTATATPFSSPMMQIPERSTFENGPASHLTSKRISSHLMMSRNNSNGIRHISAPTPPRKDPPGMFQRISSIRLEDNYPPSVPRL